MSNSSQRLLLFSSKKNLIKFLCRRIIHLQVPPTNFTSKNDLYGTHRFLVYTLNIRPACHYRSHIAGALSCLRLFLLRWIHLSRRVSLWTFLLVTMFQVIHTLMSMFFRISFLFKMLWQLIDILSWRSCRQLLCSFGEELKRWLRDLGAQAIQCSWCLILCRSFLIWCCDERYVGEPQPENGPWFRGLVGATACFTTPPAQASYNFSRPWWSCFWTAAVT